jgi:hypothetical protein
LPHRLDGVEHHVFGTVPGAADAAEGEVHHDEDRVDQCEGWLEEVVDISCDVLPELVDEPAESGASEHCDERSYTWCEGRDGDHERDQHHHPAPDGM